MAATPIDRAHGILIAGVGLSWMRDLAFGVRIIERLRLRPWPPGVDLEDWSFGTIAAFQKLSTHRYQRAVFVSGTPRGRTPGTLHRIDAPLELPPDAEIHARIGDGVMGCVSVDNLVVMGRYFRALPDAVTLIEVEPADDTWGGELSAECEALVHETELLIAGEIGMALPEVVPSREAVRQEWNR